MIFWAKISCSLQKLQKGGKQKIEDGELARAIEGILNHTLHNFMTSAINHYEAPTKNATRKRGWRSRECYSEEVHESQSCMAMHASRTHLAKNALSSNKRG